MNDSFELYWTSFSRNLESEFYISLRGRGVGGLGELVRWIPCCTELWQAKQAPWLPPGGLYWIFRSDTASGSTFNTDWVFTMCQILFQDFRDANSCNLHVIVWDKHYYFPHIPNGTVRQRGHVTCPRSLAGQWGAETGHWSQDSCSQPLINVFCALCEMFHVCP